MAPSHREKIVGKRATNAGSPPGDSEIEKRKPVLRIRLHRWGLLVVSAQEARTFPRTKRYDKLGETSQTSHPVAPSAKGNNALLCKVFPASLQGQTLSWFHRPTSNSVDNFRDLSEAFVGQYICSARQKQNISTLQNKKMQENESLREFVKRFGTPFFKSLAKKPPTTMDDLFRCASKYSMLEDDVRASTQQILVAGQASRSGAERSAKIPDQPRSSGRRQEEQSRPEQPPLTPLSISYEKLLPMIQDIFHFRWPGPLKKDPSKKDHSKKCAYHKEYGHTTEMCRSLHYLVEKLIRAGHLKQYLRSDARGRDASRNHNSGTPRVPAAPKAIINYINGGPLN
ncbi:hypothetical protein CK203_076572 [Vitis vinifera]|uniref:Retrotransposon gag domain-containing protein n=1 Tax=Vitis vinifera TaxID=29760 RepID=A0A438EYP7_VITVI|nr:hypothetical protein CK203_076572 [Vitis vinifera]